MCSSDLLLKAKGIVFLNNFMTYDFREGMNMLEYFISTHGARKGLADTALRTAKSGYLTRRLVDVAQDLIITEHDCGTEKGVCIRSLTSEQKVMIPLADRITGRTALNDIVSPETGELLVRKGQLISYNDAAAIERSGIEEVWVRSPLACALKLLRSEERRVGKECRSRWSPYH